MRTFKIVITETTRYIEDDQVWKKIADSGSKVDGGSVYDYVTRPGVVKTRTRTVLEQEVEWLDLVAVIKAVNEIK